MAYTLSAMKRQRQGQKLNARNRANASRLKTAMKKLEKVVTAPDFKTAADPKKVLTDGFVAIDTAARKGAIPKKRADRKKGRLAKRIHKALTAAAPAAPSA
ncbi:MAG TPA: 30S ribosomal protein S20 [Planctomycetota bacterium]|nr:30S ribosomal protein S20 [Planctomycetota bacterium]